MKTKSKHTTLIILLIVVFVIGVGVFLYVNKMATNPMALKLKECNEVYSSGDYNEGNRCFRDVAIQVKDLSICENIIDVRGTKYKQNCIERVTVESGKQNCELINNSGEKDLCYVNRARVTKDESACLKIESATYKNVCYGQFAQEKL